MFCVDDGSDYECECDYILPTQEGWKKHYGNCTSARLREHGKWMGARFRKNEDGTINLRNRHLPYIKPDVLYHIGFDTDNHDLHSMFGDVKFVCIGGTEHRMKEFAKYMLDVLEYPLEGDLVNLTEHSHRYAMYKVGPVLSVSHGIGIPSMSILVQEVIKLLYYAKAKNPIFFRIGTSGGLKIPPGSVVISSFGLNGTLRKHYELPILGKVHQLPAVFDERLCQEVQSVVTDEDGFETHIGGTFAADDYYRGQARLDGPFCEYSSADKMAFLNKLADRGVKNIEMEATAFAAFTTEAGIRAADVCVTLIDRLEGDQIATSTSTLMEWQKRPMIIVGRYIAKYYENKKYWESVPTKKEENCNNIQT